MCLQIWVGFAFLFTQLYHFIILLFSQSGPMRLSKLQLNSTVFFFKVTNSPLAESALNTGFGLSGFSLSASFAFIIHITFFSSLIF